MIEKERARRIVDEVVTYFLSHDCQKIISEMAFEAEGLKQLCKVNFQSSPLI